MNTANLQLEGLLLAMGQLIRLMVDKGIVSQDEVSGALRHADAIATSDQGKLRDANAQAILFPIRYLIAASEDGDTRPFHEIAAEIGRARDRAQFGGRSD